MPFQEWPLKPAEIKGLNWCITPKRGHITNVYSFNLIINFSTTTQRLVRKTPISSEKWENTTFSRAMALQDVCLIYLFN